MIAHALDHRQRAAVAHAEPLAGDPAEVGLAAGGTVEHHVADDDVLLGRDPRVGGRAHHQAAAAQPLADVVVGVAVEGEGDAVREPGAEGLAGGAAQRDADGVVGQSRLAVPAGDLAAQHAPDGAVAVADRQLDLHRVAVLERRLGEGDDLVVEGLVEAVVLLDHPPDEREVEPTRLPVIDRLADVEDVGAADHLVEAAEAESRHVTAHVLGEEGHEVDHVLRLAGELLAQPLVLGGDADRAGVEVADPHHDAAGGDQGGGGETHVLGAEQAGHDDVSARLHLAVDLDGDAGAQPVADQRLLRLGQAQLPGDAGRLDRAERRRPGAALVAGDDDMVGAGLGHPGGDGAHTDLGHELD